MTAPRIHREGQRPAPTPAQGNALSLRSSWNPSPERATKPLPNNSAALSGLTPSFTVYPGRCPGLAWAGPLALLQAIGQQAAAQLPWFHIVTLITKVSDPAMRAWYAREAVTQGWPRDTLTLHIKNQFGEGQRPDSYPAQGNALGTRLRIIPALKGRPNPCHNHSLASRSTWSSAPSIANVASQMICALRFMPIWRPCCRTSVASLFSSTRSKIMCTFFLNWRGLYRSARSLKPSKPVHLNGLRPRAAVMSDSRGRLDMEPFRSVNRRLPSSMTISLTSRSIIEKRPFRMNVGPSLNSIAWDSTNGMSGIRSPFQGSHHNGSLSQGVALGCDRPGLWPSRRPGIGYYLPVISKMETTHTSASLRLRVSPLESAP